MGTEFNGNTYSNTPPLSAPSTGERLLKNFHSVPCFRRLLSMPILNLFFMSFISIFLGLREAVQLGAKSSGLGDGHASKPLSAPSKVSISSTSIGLDDGSSESEESQVQDSSSGVDDDFPNPNSSEFDSDFVNMWSG
ncbi:hypothetical protein ACHAW5_010511 [Stephanodiscus triporus]|uniref:Uncharacterized protein n=1 Tax=Stephanodiscus triporus TaxID=2934178 RepID=A0ABD3P6V6_9STRA